MLSSDEGRGDVGQLRERLRLVLKERCYREGEEITLTSGRKSNFYINGKMATLDPEGLYLVGRVLLDKIRSSGAEAIGGLTLGADPIVAAVALVSYLQGTPVYPFIVRKEAKAHGTRSDIEGPPPDGKKVAVVDDVVTTGGSLWKAIEAAEAHGCKVVQVLCLVDRQEGGGETFRKKGYRFDPVFTVSDLRR